MAKTPGQIAYESDVAARPHYHDGTPRKPWDRLAREVRETWERNPTPRWPVIRADDWPPYGMEAGGTGRCINAEPGTFGHECGKPARWIAGFANGSSACFCDDCKANGHEARRATTWIGIADAAHPAGTE